MHCKKLATGKRMQFKGWTGMSGCHAHPGGSAQRAAFPQLQQEYGLHAVSLAEEYEKRNRELRKVRRFLREKSQKTTFEINLQQTFDLFWKRRSR